MITDEQVRWIALFFLLTLMDEKVALQAAHDVIAALKASAKTSQPLSTIDLIETLQKSFVSQRKQLPRIRKGRGANAPENPPETPWQVPQHLDFKVWKKFHQTVGEVELLAVVFAKVLNFTENEIAEGLYLSVGTVHYRIAKGVRLLGASFVASTRGLK